MLLEVIRTFGKKLAICEKRGKVYESLILDESFAKFIEANILQIVFNLRSLLRKYDLYDLRFHLAMHMNFYDLTFHMLVEPSILTFKWLCASNIG